MKWENLTSEQQFSDLLVNQALFAVFKHSTRCNISSMVKNRVEREWNLDFPVYYLDLLNYRSVSNFIASATNIEHESPQLIVFQNGKAIYNGSHSAIIVDDVKAELVS